LCQLEKFDDIIIATTNAFTSLDLAVYRRFHAKFELKPLFKKQKINLLKRVAKHYALFLDISWHQVNQWIDELPQLTPGDFNSVNHRLNWLAISKISDYVKQLEQEQQVKQKAKPIGFML